MDAKGKTVTRTGRTVVMFATLLLFWLMLMGRLTIDVLVVGALASLVIALLFPNGLSFFTEFRATPEAFVAGLRYYGYFFKELVKSNLRLAAIVLSPSLPIEPGIVKVRTRLKSRMGRLMLANSITLTPGTLTVEMDGEWLYIHWVSVQSADIEAATAAIVAGFERYLEVIYG
jgi:multicomponent Na+:H+ antiporter subunit E